MTNRFERQENPVVLEHEVQDSGSELKITVKVDQHCEMSDLSFLFQKPDSIIRSALSKKEWINTEGTIIVNFKMNVLEKKNRDGTQEWIFRYYLPSDRQ